MLISLLKADAVSIVGGLSQCRFLITETNRDEIRRPTESGRLDIALRRGEITISPLLDPAGLLDFGDFLMRIGPGEAATIAQAKILGAHVLMHDRAGRALASVQLGPDRIHTLEDLVVEAIRSGTIISHDGDMLGERLRKLNDYGMPRIAAGFAAAARDPSFGINRIGTQPSRE